MIFSAAAQLEAILQSGCLPTDRRFSADEIRLLSLHYQLILKWNERLHLTTITKPAEFVERHICEAALAASLLGEDVEQVWDLGSGAGIPGLPIAVLRSDLNVTLVESSRSKAIFLEEVIAALSLRNVSVRNERIESIPVLPSAACLTARAVDRMEKLLPLILKIGNSASQLLIFGNVELEKIIRQNVALKTVTSYLLPQSANRFLIEVRST
jgi:16S rRNA (guanine527-N7)-methyltransferase